MMAGVYASPDNGYIIRGKVTDSAGKALAGAGVTIENTFLGVHTDSEGRYQITGLKAGNYTLSFSFIGYETRVNGSRSECRSDIGYITRQ